MDICVLNPYFYPYYGGTEKVLLQVYSRLAKKHNITVLTSNAPGKAKSTDYVKGIRVVRLESRYTNFPGLPLPYVSMPGLNEEIIKEKAEIYHINNRFQYAMSNINAIKQTRAKIAITIHNSLPQGIDFLTDSGGLIYDIMIGRRIIHSSDLITGVSKYAIESTVPKNDRGRAHVVYNGVDSKLFRPRKRRHENIIHVLNNGRLVPQKGQEYLIKAVALLAREREIDLTIIGKGPLERKLLNLAAKEGMASRFRIISQIKESEMPRYYNNADVFALPSLYEPAGLALLEAMACATPSIATQIGGIPEVMGKCGLYVEPNSVTSIYEKLSYIVSNTHYAKKLGECARKRVIENNNWDKIAKEYERLFSITLKN
ncbi:MAG: glycosyltransferase family 4 protein [Candidatus Micrarchaeia archaeon]